ncbi:CCA tRNA nucleotidyltransferase, partial [Candidatus Dojkabacteria bacterium]|nr:CCA tRNA nucleotidyltransferase [Candidatus Dojkabacteria bacterium]
MNRKCFTLVFMGIGFPTNRIPTYVKSTAKTLIDSGYSAYLVGGAVRDLLLEKNTKDFDIATNALPEEVTSLFPKSITTGSKFGNIIVVAEDEYGERYDVDVTTFRKDEDYFGGRWPTSVEFSKTIESDLSRRDFTINALALDLNTVLTDSDKFIEVNDLDDHHNGIDDLLNKVIRTVGDPYERFKEDGLRAFRACRFASELNFTIAEDTKEAIKVSKNIAEMISMERIRDEFLKILMHSKNPSTGIRLLDELNLLDFVIPELIKTKGINQPEWHDQDVFEHSLKTMDLAEDNIKVAALLHDIGKAYTKTTDSDGNVHFYGHDVKGAEVSKKILKRLRFSNAEIDRISNLIRWHMFYYPSADWRKDNKIETLEESEENNFESDDHGWG